MIRREGEFGEEGSRETSFLSFPSQSVSPSLVRLTMKSAGGEFSTKVYAGGLRSEVLPLTFL